MERRDSSILLLLNKRVISSLVNVLQLQLHILLKSVDNLLVSGRLVQEGVNFALPLLPHLLCIDVHGRVAYDRHVS